MDTVSTIIGFMSMFDFNLTSSTADNLKVLFRGAVLAARERTVTACMLAAWPWIIKHWTVYENTIRRARFCMLLLSRTLFQAIILLIPANVPLLFIIDESLVRRYGPYVTGIGMHRDAVRSSHSNLVVTPGNKWVVFAVAIPLPFTERYYALPILNLMYISKKHAKRNKVKPLYRKHRTVGELAMIMLKIVTRWAPKRHFLLVADGAYATHEIADHLNSESTHPRLRYGTLVSRFRLDGSTYEKPGKYKGRGRKPVKGKKLPSPIEIANRKNTKWKTAEVEWYGGVKRKIQYISRTAFWYKCGYRPTWIHWVLVRDPEGEKLDEVFFTTSKDLSPIQIIEYYVRRWPLETTFQEVREQLGLETLRNRSRNAILRSVPLLLAVYSIVVVWFANYYKNPKKAIQTTPWYKKETVTFSDMLAAAQHDILRDVIKQPSVQNTGEFLIRGQLKLLYKGHKTRIKKAA